MYAVLATFEVGTHPCDEQAVGVAGIVDRQDATTDVPAAPQHVVDLQLGARDDCHLDSREPG